MPHLRRPNTLCFHPRGWKHPSRRAHIRSRCAYNRGCYHQITCTFTYHPLSHVPIPYHPDTYYRITRPDTTTPCTHHIGLPTHTRARARARAPHRQHLVASTSLGQATSILSMIDLRQTVGSGGSTRRGSSFAAAPWGAQTTRSTVRPKSQPGGTCSQ